MVMVVMCVPMLMLVRVFMIVNAAGAFMDMSVVLVFMTMVVFMVMRQVHVEFDSGDGGFLPERNMEVVAVELEFLQLAFEFFGVHAKIEQGGDEHVASDAADEVQVKSFCHAMLRGSHRPLPHTALIWLAA
jgi:hypothetical protein